MLGQGLQGRLTGSPPPREARPRAGTIGISSLWSTGARGRDKLRAGWGERVAPRAWCPGDGGGEGVRRPLPERLVGWAGVS